jgi:hypothetical protein
LILYPGILALLLGAALVLLLLLYAAGNGLLILRRWDLTSSSELQLGLERRTCLISTLVHYALGFQALSLLLFVYTVDSLHPLFVGAMCATGTLNANPVGWNVLLVKLAGFFLAGLWVVVNHYDQQAEDYPLVKIKYRLLLLLVPLVLLDGYWQLGYFLGLRPEIITSCCGSLFSAEGSGVASTMATLPLVPMIWIFYLWTALLAILLGTCFWLRGLLVRGLLAVAGGGCLVVGLASVISFISVYYYQLPTHHCPFDLAQAGYNFIGYPLYLTLFGAVFCALVPFLLGWLGHYGSLATVLPGRERNWLIAALVFLLGLLMIVSWPLVFGAFTMQPFM